MQNQASSPHKKSISGHQCTWRRLYGLPVNIAAARHLQWIPMQYTATLNSVQCTELCYIFEELHCNTSQNTYLRNGANELHCAVYCVWTEHWSADFLMRHFPHLTAALHHCALHKSAKYSILLLSSSLNSIALCSPVHCSALQLLTLVFSQCIRSCFSQRAFHSCLS